MNILKKTAQKYPTIVNEMCSAAVLAGIKIMDVYLKDDFNVEIKNDDSPITLADRLSDAVIEEHLKINFSNIPIVSEEGHFSIKDGKDDIFFLVDPLDGTKEFIKKTGEFTVNIALIVNSKTEFGVVYVPVTGELFYRDLDGVSYLEIDLRNSEVRVERSKLLCRQADKSNLSIVTSLSHSNPETNRYVALYAPSNCKSAGSSLKFGLIAQGVADLYPRLGRTMEWDTAAAHAVLKGAGGNVHRLDTLEELSYGKANMENPFFVASSPGLSLIPYKQED